MEIRHTESAEYIVSPLSWGNNADLTEFIG
jgi:hypothetical protein